MDKLEARALSAEEKLAKVSSQKTELETESSELRQRAESLSEELTRTRTESKIKVAEYKRQSSAAGESSTELFMRQLAERDTELETLTARYANLNDELQISRNRANEQIEDLTASADTLMVEIEFYKSENVRMKEEVNALTEAATSEGGGDAVMRTRLEVHYKTAAIL